MIIKRTVSIIAAVSLLLASVVTAFAEDKFKYSEEYKSSPYYAKLNAAIENFGDKSGMERTLAVALSQEGYKNYATTDIDIEQARADGLLWTGKELRMSSDLTGNTEYTRWFTRYVWDMGESEQYSDWDWCAIFVSWCLYQAGYSGDERLKRYYYTPLAEPRIEFAADTWLQSYNFDQMGVYYTPKAHHKLDRYNWNTYYHVDIDPLELPYQPGGIIFFSWDASGAYFDHVAIVVDYDKDTHVLTYTNGNSDGQVITREMDLDNVEEYRGKALAKNSDRMMAYVDYDLITPPEPKDITTDTPLVTWDKSEEKGFTVKTNSESIIASVNMDNNYFGSIIESNMVLHEGALTIGKSELTNLPIGKHRMRLVFDDGVLNVDLRITDVNNPQIGDVTRDEAITVSDVTAIQRHLANIEPLDEFQLSLADTNGDKVVDVNDASYLQKYIAGFDVVLGEDM